MAEAAAVYQEEEFEFDLKNMVMSRMERAELIAAKNYTELNGNLQLLRLEMQTGDSALKAEINALRGDMQSSNDALRAEIKSGDDALRAEINALRSDMKSSNEALRAEIKSGDDALRAEINNLRTETQGEFKSVRGEIKALGENLNGKINELRAELKGDSDMLATAIEDLQRSQSNNIASAAIIVGAVCTILSAIVSVLAQYFMR